MEHVSVIVYSPPDKRILIVSGYNPPNRALSVKDLDPIFSTNIPAVLIGDLNSKHIAWNCAITDTNGKTLLDYCTAHSVNILSGISHPFPLSGAT
jgi:hypothetical protein